MLLEANLQLSAMGMLGPDHPITHKSRSLRARAYKEAGQSGKTESLLHEKLELAREWSGPDDYKTADVMAELGSHLLKQEKWAEAELILRDCLKIRDVKSPGYWSRFNARSMLGSSLVGQKKYAEAEPLLLSAYEGMKAPETNYPPAGNARLSEATARIIQLYDAWGKPEKAAEWRTRFGLAPELPADPFAR
jgi:hypothetical protein